ncbi:MAG: hypothetical protein D6689_07670 [Deltaproteobacteria bacterium]|nr:MAG: hypothetical protein D6689_07670 [Deltaproteobacteria bacterium]
MVVTSARLTPDASLNGGTIQYYLSNEDPPVWIEATQAACGDGSGDVCANFDKPVGRAIRWKAVMCSNDFHTTTPELKGLTIKFDYAEAKVHYRAGVVVHDGVAYSGGFRQPGDRGHLFATNLGNATGTSQTGTVYWDAAAKLDAMADGARHVYTVTSDGGQRVDLSAANASSEALHDALGLPVGQTSSEATAAQVATWVRSARFGVGNDGIPLSRHGAVETSTPAVLGPPGKPPWYGFLSFTDKTKWDQFEQAHANRPTLVLYGAKDQMIHAVYTNPSNLTDSRNGEEQWAIVPPKVAAGLVADYFATQTAGELKVTAYPDGSPTLADVQFASDGEFHTVALVGGGNGGRSVFAMDVTDTIAADGTVVGPTPLWTVTPGGSDAGYARSKPVVIRVKIGSDTKYLAVFGTGPDPAASDKGRRVVAVDVETGALMWQFDAECAVTSDIAAFETNDEAEPGDPTFDGSIDRVVFADACGYVYKIDPQVQVPLTEPENGFTQGIGPVTTPSGAVALFSTAATAELGAQRPIVGTIGARADATGRIALFFGTGGLESYDPSKPNAFFAVYADTGELRSSRVGTCTGGRCEKFYGGVVVTSDQVIATRSVDPPIASATCELGETVIEGYALNPDTDGDFVIDFTQTLAAASVAALYGDAGALYTSTLGGTLVRIGAPAATDAGAGPGGPEFGQGEAGQGGGGFDVGAAKTSPFSLLGWFQKL